MFEMKRIALFLAAVVALCSYSPAQAGPVSFTFDGNQGSLINFSAGGSFSFSPASGNAFTITNVFNGTGLSGLQGNITGSFTIGSVSTSGGVESASVSGTGTFTIYDASSVALTATLTWGGIETNTNGSGGTLNYALSVNLSGFSYSGSNLGLQSLLQEGQATAWMQFTTIPPTSLNGLAALSGSSTVSAGYDGGLTTAPEPSSMAIFGIGLLGLAGSYGWRCGARWPSDRPGPWPLLTLASASCPGAEVFCCAGEFRAPPMTASPISVRLEQKDGRTLPKVLPWQTRP